MALTRITEGVIKPNENYVVNNINSSGVTTSTNFKTGTSNLHNVGIEIAGINVLGADTPIGTGATIYDAGGAVFTGVVTATSFSGSGNIGGVDGNFSGNVTGVDATFSGNVSVGGTLTYEDVTNIDSVGIVTARNGLRVTGGTSIFTGNTTFNGTNTFAGNSTVSGNYLDINDGKKLRLGTDGDLHLYHQGGANFIKNSSSQIIHIQTDASIRFNSTTGSENILIGEANGPVKLFYNNVEKLTTASSGVNIVGTTTTGQLAVTGVSTFSGGILANAGVTITDNQYLNLGAHNGSDARLWHDNSGGGHTYLFSYHSSGVLKIADDTNVILGKTTNYNYINCTPTTTELFAGGNKKFWTTSTGAELTGTMNIANSAGQSHYQITQASGNTVKFGIVSGSDIELSGSSNNSMYFKTNNTERLHITGAGRVGIGTAIPGAEFEVRGAGTVALFKGTGGNAFIGLTDVDAGAGIGYIGSDNGALLFQTPGSSYSTKLRIHSDGKIDVGGNENAYKFNVIDKSNRTTTAETALLLYAKHDGTGTTGAGFGTGIRFWGDRASGNVEQNMGRIMCTAEVNSGTTLSGALSFETSVAGSLAERLRITSQGRFNIGEANLTQTATSLNVTRNAGGTVAGESVIAATCGDNTTMVSALLTVRNAGNRGDRGNSAGSKLVSFEFNNKSALTIDKDGLVQIGGDSGVSGTWHHEVYNDNGDGRALLAGTSGAWLELRDTVSSERVVLAANGGANLYSYKPGDRLNLRTTNSSGSTNEAFSIDSDGRVYISASGYSRPNHGNSYLNVYVGSAIGEGIAIIGQDGNNQNSHSGYLAFDGYAQSNGAWIRGENAASWGKKDLVMSSSYGTGNNYTTRGSAQLRLAWQGFTGIGEAAATNAGVTSLLHIKGNSDNSSDHATVTIEDADTTAGSREPILAFDGNGTRQGRIMSHDTLGMYFGTGSSNNTVIQLTDKRDLYVHANSRSWATMQLGNIRYHCRQHYSNGNFVVTQSLMRVKRYWWGWGSYKITAKLHYYGSHSGESTFFLNGHGNNDSYSIKRLDQSLTGGGDNHYGSSSLISITSPSNSSPGNATTSFVDVQINIPNYTYAIIVMECMSSQYTTDPTNMGNDSYCLL